MELSLIPLNSCVTYTHLPTVIIIQGTLSFPDGSTYEGAFEGVRHGEGTMRYSDGGVYIGSKCVMKWNVFIYN